MRQWANTGGPEMQTGRVCRAHIRCARSTISTAKGRHRGSLHQCPGGTDHPRHLPGVRARKRGQRRHPEGLKLAGCFPGDIHRHRVHDGDEDDTSARRRDGTAPHPRVDHLQAELVLPASGAPLVHLVGRGGAHHEQRPEAVPGFLVGAQQAAQAGAVTYGFLRLDSTQDRSRQLHGLPVVCSARRRTEEGGQVSCVFRGKTGKYCWG